MLDVALAIEILVPAANYFGSVTDNTEESYSSLEWLDERGKPAWRELKEAFSRHAQGSDNE